MRKTIAFYTTIASLLSLGACNDTADPKPGDGSGGSTDGYAGSAGKPSYAGTPSYASFATW